MQKLYRLLVLICIPITFHAYPMLNDHQQLFARFKGLPVELQRIILTQVFKPTIMGLAWKEHFKLQGHSGGLRSVAFNHDGSLLASASYDRTVRLWNPASGKQLNMLTGHSGGLRSVAFNHDGSLLASASYDRTARLWDPASGKQLNMLTGHYRCVRSVAFNHDCSLLASASDDRTVRLWNPSSGQQLNTLTGHSGFPTSLAFNHDGLLLASGSHDGTVQLWQSDHQKILAFLQKNASSSDLEQNREQIKLIYYLHTLLKYRKNISHTVDVSAIKQTHSATLLAIKTASPEMAEYLDRLFTEIAQPN